VYQQVQVEGIELTFRAYQRCITTKVVIGGIFTSTLLTLLILPSVYEKFGVKIEKHEDRR